MASNSSIYLIRSQTRATLLHFVITRRWYAAAAATAIAVQSQKPVAYRPFCVIVRRFRVQDSGPGLRFLVSMGDGLGARIQGIGGGGVRASVADEARDPARG